MMPRLQKYIYKNIQTQLHIKERNENNNQLEQFPRRENNGINGNQLKQLQYR